MMRALALWLFPKLPPTVQLAVVLRYAAENAYDIRKRAPVVYPVPPVCRIGERLGPEWRRQLDRAMQERRS